MNRVELEKLIDEKKKVLDVPYQKDPAYSFFSDFVSHNPCSKMSDFLTIDICGLMKCMMYLKVDDFSIEDCSLKIDQFSSLLDELDEEGLDDLLAFLANMCECQNTSNFIQFLNETSHLKERFLAKKMFPLEKKAFSALSDFKEEFADYLDDVIAILNFMEEDIDLFSSLIQFARIHKAVQTDKASLDERIDALPWNLRAKEYNKALAVELKDNYKVPQILQLIKPVYTFVSESDREERDLQKYKEREIRGYDKALNLLDKSLDKEEITKARSIIKQIRDEEVKFAILQFIYEHNQPYYEQLVSEYQEISSNTKVKYRSLLHSFGIETENLNLEEIMHNKLSEVEKMLSYLKNKKFDDDLILDVLRNTNFIIFEEVKDYIDKGYFSNMFITCNREIFYSGSSMLELFRKNKKVLESYGVNPYVFRNHLNLLFTESNLLGESLAVLANYGLLKSLKNTDNLSFLIKQDFVFKIDQLLELGYEKMLEENLDLLNYDNLMRLEVLKSSGFVLESIDEVEAVLKSDKFMLPDDKLEEYLLNVVDDVDLDTIIIPEQSLDSFRESLRTYKIGDNLISICKVKRLLNSGKGLLEAVTSNCFLNDREFDKIVDALGGENKGGQTL